MNRKLKKRGHIHLMLFPRPGITMWIEQTSKQSMYQCPLSPSTWFIQLKLRIPPLNLPIKLTIFNHRLDVWVHLIIVVFFLFLGILPLFTLRQFNIFLMLLGIWVCLFLIKVTFGTSRLLLLFYSQILKNHNKKIPTIFIYRANRTEFLQIGAAKPHILLCAPD